MALILRTCNADMTSYNNFKWPESGPVKCPDWEPHDRCGNGLHGALWGEGSGSLLNWEQDAKWLVIEVPDEIIIHGTGDMIGKCKFPYGNVVYCGNREGATNYIYENGGVGKAIIGRSATAGDYGQAAAGDKGISTAGDYGQATAGDYGQAAAGYKGQATAGDYGQATAGDKGQAAAGDKGQATAGEYGQATAGDYGQATAGDYGIAIAGDSGQATAGDYGIATAGDYGIAIAGDSGQATAGYKGQATAGDYGQATAGDKGQATAGYKGQAAAGDGGIIVIRYWDGKRRRLKIGYIGEDGLKPNVTYKLDNNHNFVGVKK